MKSRLHDEKNNLVRLNRVSLFSFARNDTDPPTCSRYHHVNTVLTRNRYAESIYFHSLPRRTLRNGRVTKIYLDNRNALVIESSLVALSVNETLFRLKQIHVTFISFSNIGEHRSKIIHSRRFNKITYAIISIIILFKDGVYSIIFDLFSLKLLRRRDCTFRIEIDTTGSLRELFDASQLWYFYGLI